MHSAGTIFRGTEKRCGRLQSEHSHQLGDGDELHETARTVRRRGRDASVFRAELHSELVTALRSSPSLENRHQVSRSGSGGVALDLVSACKRGRHGLEDDRQLGGNRGVLGDDLEILRIRAARLKSRSAKSRERRRFARRSGRNLDGRPEGTPFPGASQAGVSFFGDAKRRPHLPGRMRNRLRPSMR